METLHFNQYRPPILPIEMLDDEHTIIQVVPPTVALQEELRARSADLHALLSGGDDEKRTALFDLAARLMSCNRNMRAITPEQLKTTFRLVEEDLVVFFEAYTNFVRRIENAKN